MAFLHDSVAAMEAQKGNADEAARHLRLARRLLEVRGNAWLEQLIALNASCLALIEGDFSSFQHWTTAARHLAIQTGHGATDSAMAANDAHFALLRGDFDAALPMLDRVLRAPMTVYVQLAAQESLARLHFATGSLGACRSALETIDEIRRNNLELAYGVRSAATVNVRLLLRGGRFVEAADLARSELDKFEIVNDIATRSTLRSLLAVALRETGEPTMCAQAILEAGSSRSTLTQDVLAHYCYVSGIVVASSAPPLSAALKDRGHRIWRLLGNRYGPIEASATIEASHLARTKQPTPVGGEAVRTGVTLNHVAGALDLAHSSSLLSDELLALLRNSDLSGRICDAKEEGHDRGIRTVSLPLDTADSNLVLVCDVPDDPAKAIILGDILRIGQAAVALEQAREEERNRAALWPADPVESQGGAIFLAEEMQEVLGVARRIASADVPVLITGETGTGKEVLARTIHGYSKRAKGSFLPFNCTSTPREMLDSQLFGHRRGAFTGATESFPGVVRSAAGGTLFLDEIGDMGLDVQPKLLRFLESNEIHPIGEGQPQRVDVRVIVATNADIDTLVTEGRFREDLYYRLSIVKLHLPPLRERRVEIPTLANHYLQKHALEYGKSGLRITEETMEYLVLYRWPGNVRQLANEMRRLAVMAESGAVLMPEHLTPEIAASRKTIPASQRALTPTEIIVRLDQPLAAAVQHVEQTMLRYALEKCGHRLEETAALLGLSRKGLYLKRQRLGIDPPGDADSLASGA
jgi:DNA-binding NtrC family response regulator